MIRKTRPAPVVWGLAAVAALAAAVPLEAQENTTSTAVSGEVRLRTEAARPTSDSWENFTLLRTRIGLLATLNPGVRAFVQLQDARAFGEQPSTMHGSASQIDLHQGYVELSTALGGAPLALRVGRQEIVLGNERLVGAVGWSNTGRSFDAARLTLGAPGGWSGGGFVATLHESNPRFRSANVSHLENDHWFSGAYLARGAAEVFGLYDRNAHFGAYTEVNRATVGGRLQAPARTPAFASVEGAYQFGTQRAQVSQHSVTSQDIGAWFAGARAGLRTGAAVLPSVGVGLDYLSGDADALGSSYGAFQTLYATNHRYYGYMDLFLDPAAATRHRGLVDAMVNVRAGLGTLGTLEIDVHRFSLADAAGLENGEIGWELDLTYPFRIADAARFMVGYSAFRGGPAAAEIGLGPDGRIRHWGFVQAAVPF
jgi:hypothetical protein